MRGGSRGRHPAGDRQALLLLLLPALVVGKTVDERDVVPPLLRRLLLLSLLLTHTSNTRFIPLLVLVLHHRTPTSISKACACKRAPTQWAPTSRIPLHTTRAGQHRRHTSGR